MSENFRLSKILKFPKFPEFTKFPKFRNIQNFRNFYISRIFEFQKFLEFLKFPEFSKFPEFLKNRKLRNFEDWNAPSGPGPPIYAGVWNALTSSIFVVGGSVRPFWNSRTYSFLKITEFLWSISIKILSGLQVSNLVKIFLLDSNICREDIIIQTNLLESKEGW